MAAIGPGVDVDRQAGVTVIVENALGHAPFPRPRSFMPCASKKDCGSGSKSRLNWPGAVPDWKGS
jgi:hypothetical protein